MILVPAAHALGIDMIWFGVMIGMNLQTSFLTPPFGFSLFYLRGVTPPNDRDLQRRDPVHRDSADRLARDLHLARDRELDRRYAGRLVSEFGRASLSIHSSIRSDRPPHGLNAKRPDDAGRNGHRTEVLLLSLRRK
jgi:hypothetical protein